jgi:hypothetical protein
LQASGIVPANEEPQHGGQCCRTGRTSGVLEGCLEEGYQSEEEDSPGPQKGHRQSRQTS